MRKTFLGAAIVLATAGVAIGTAGPALAADPTTDFPQLTNATGATDVTITWLNRSVVASGAVSDRDSGDGVDTVVCIDGYTGPNATGTLVNDATETCRGASGRSRGFEFTIPWDQRGGIQSVRVYIGRSSASQGIFALDDFRTRNRPAA